MPDKSILVDKMILKSEKPELRRAIEIIYPPYIPDSDGNFARPESIRGFCESFNENLAAGNVKTNLYHLFDDDGNVVVDEGFSVVKTWVTECDCSINGEDVSEGTWIGEFQYDEALWERKKKGLLKGVSIGAKGKVRVKKQEPEDD